MLGSGNTIVNPIDVDSPVIKSFAMFIVPLQLPLSH
jgi:hypothetical protein